MKKINFVVILLGILISLTGVDAQAVTIKNGHTQNLTINGQEVRPGAVTQIKETIIEVKAPIKNFYGVDLIWHGKAHKDCEVKIKTSEKGIYKHYHAICGEVTLMCFSNDRCSKLAERSVVVVTPEQIEKMTQELQQKTHEVLREKSN